MHAGLMCMLSNSSVEVDHVCFLRFFSFESKYSCLAALANLVVALTQWFVCFQRWLNLWLRGMLLGWLMWLG
ncbi:hypothetical protein EE082_27590 [Klebsiella pneumoniae]|nr:hypothetical protein [Klebsiella pneumoniae]